MKREFIYFKVFDKNWTAMGLTSDDLTELENAIMRNPTVGKVIQGTGSVRKMRFALANKKGKSGGARILYIDYISLETTVLLNTYSKNEKDSITDSEKIQLKKIADGISKELKE